MITSDILTSLMPNLNNPDDWVTALAKATAHFEINDQNNVSMFLAQTIYESEGFSVITENLNYSSQALLSMFKNYFPNAALANEYARQPEKIANRIYANRMGNGDEASGDGWAYRGRSLIQITGKTNYMAFADTMSMQLSDVVNYLETTEGAAMGAAWFWNYHGLNDLADQNEFTQITQIINGGLTGLSERESILSRVQTVLT